jgi:GNAT superfamily N-acetyltransferase
MEWRRDEYLISDDRARVDLDAVHGFLTTCYWAEGISRELVQRSVEHALAFSLWFEPAASAASDFAPPRARQAGFARVVSDYATFAYLGDVFVLEEFRGRGLSKWMMQIVVEHPRLQGLRRWSLLTRDAHRLYEGIGFRPLAAPDRWMERWDPEVYRRGPARESR